MLRFENKTKLFNWIVQSFDGKAILVRGSTAFGPVKKFSDFDIEIWGKKRDEHYDIIIVENKLALLTINFYDYKNGPKAKTPKNMKILKGQYNKNLEPTFTRETRTGVRKVKRECQLLLDFMFKYLRSGDKKALHAVKKRIQ